MEGHIGPIVVAYDGSEPSEAAVDWAAAEAERSGRPLTVLHVASHWSLVPLPVPAPWRDPEGGDVGCIARQGVDRARRIAGSVEIHALTRTARAASSLIDQSSAASLIVVGTRAHGELAGMLLGSVAFQVSAHSHCPVVVVRGDSSQLPGPQCPIVVGVDGSTSSAAALRYAADLAAQAQAPLIVVTVYRPLTIQSVPEALSSDDGGDAPQAPAHQAEGYQIAAKAATDAVTAARTLYPQLDLRRQVLLGVTVGQLCTIAHRAGLLVMGSSGDGGFAGLRLGSVNHGAIRDSPCPVAMVPGRSLSLPPTGAVDSSAIDQSTEQPVSTRGTVGDAR